MRRFTAIVVLLMSACLLFAEGQGETQEQSKEISFNFGHVMPVEHPEHKAAVRMKELISEASDGRIVMNIFPSTQLGGDRELMTSLMNSTLEMACVEIGRASCRERCRTSSRATTI